MIKRHVFCFLGVFSGKNREFGNFEGGSAKCLEKISGIREYTPPISSVGSIVLKIIYIKYKTLYRRGCKIPEFPKIPETGVVDKPLFERDKIVHERAKNGKGGGTHKFYCHPSDILQESFFTPPLE